jgi:hypothetical protein
MPSRPRLDARSEAYSTLFEAREFGAALVVAELAVAQDPSNDHARDFAARCRQELESSYLARVGSLDRTPKLRVALRDLAKLSLDHRAGFVLSLVDGVSPLEMLLDSSGLPRFDVLRIVVDLLDRGVIELDG